jgi:hypothetical protein
LQGEVDAGDPTCREGIFIRDILGCHRGTAWSHQRGERGKACGVAHQVDEGIDAVGVRLWYGLWQRDLCVVDGLDGTVGAHTLGILGVHVCDHLRPGVHGELGSERTNAAARTDDQHRLVRERL